MITLTIHVLILVPVLFVVMKERELRNRAQEQWTAISVSEACVRVGR
jgi:hypothetical protein